MAPQVKPHRKIGFSGKDAQTDIMLNKGQDSLEIRPITVGGVSRMTEPFYAHSANAEGQKHLLVTHLTNVAWITFLPPS
jgi:hypothetical protein